MTLTNETRRRDHRAAADDLRLRRAHARGSAVRGRPLHHGRILVHGVHVLRESGCDDRARSVRYLNRVIVMQCGG
jgi:hypothetical protein